MRDSGTERPIKVLNLDDEPGFNEQLRQTLSKNIFELKSTLTEKDFLEALSSVTPDLIILDLILGGIRHSGIKLIEKIRGELKLETPIIILSRFDDLKTVSEALSAGASDFLSRPLDEALLKAKIYSLVRHPGLEDRAFNLAKIPPKESECTVEYPFYITELSEFGITLTSDAYISRGTKVLLQGDFLNEVFKTAELNLELTETKRSPMGKYLLFLAFAPEDGQLISRARKWLGENLQRL